MRFGKYVLAGTVSTFVVVRGNEFLVAKLVGVDLYGYYALTLSLIRVIYDSIGQLISSLVFPALSKIQDDRGRMGRAFSKVFRVATLLTAPLTVGVAIFGRDIVHLILGVKWMLIVGPLAWLCFFGWFNALTLTMEAAHYSLGKPELQARLRFAELILYLVGALPMTIKFGIVGAAAWLCMVKIVSFFLHLWASRSYLVGVVRSCGETLFNYWPLGVAQLILAYLHFDMPTAGLGAVILLLSYCLLVVLFVLWKEKELVVEVITVLMERPRLSGAA